MILIRGIATSGRTKRRTTIISASDRAPEIALNILLRLIIKSMEGRLMACTIGPLTLLCYPPNPCKIEFPARIERFWTFGKDVNEHYNVAHILEKCKGIKFSSKTKNTPLLACFSCDPWGNRTPVIRMKTWCPNH